jgi:hypothetical protein
MLGNPARRIKPTDRFSKPSHLSHRQIFQALSSCLKFYQLSQFTQLRKENGKCLSKVKMLITTCSLTCSAGGNVTFSPAERSFDSELTEWRRDWLSVMVGHLSALDSKRQKEPMKCFVKFKTTHLSLLFLSLHLIQRPTPRTQTNEVSIRHYLECFYMEIMQSDSKQSYTHYVSTCGATRR